MGIRYIRNTKHIAFMGGTVTFILHFAEIPVISAVGTGITSFSGGDLKSLIAYTSGRNGSVMVALVLPFPSQAQHLAVLLILIRWPFANSS